MWDIDWSGGGWVLPLNSCRQRISRRKVEWKKMQIDLVPTTWCSNPRRGRNLRTKWKSRAECEEGLQRTWKQEDEWGGQKPVGNCTEVRQTGLVQEQGWDLGCLVAHEARFYNIWGCWVLCWGLKAHVGQESHDKLILWSYSGFTADRDPSEKELKKWGNYGIQLQCEPRS